jgi:hypothetical protein
MKLTISHGDKDYVGDILYRVYYNKDLRPNPVELFCFEVLTRNGCSSKYAGRYTSEHPQGAKEMMRNVLEEFKDTKVHVEISNEFRNGDGYNTWLGPEFMGQSWFDGAIESVCKGAST